MERLPWMLAAASTLVVLVLISSGDVPSPHGARGTNAQGDDVIDTGLWVERSHTMVSGEDGPPFLNFLVPHRDRVPQLLRLCRSIQAASLAEDDPRVRVIVVDFNTADFEHMRAQLGVWSLSSGIDVLLLSRPSNFVRAKALQIAVDHTPLWRDICVTVDADMVVEPGLLRILRDGMRADSTVLLLRPFLGRRGATLEQVRGGDGTFLDSCGDNYLAFTKRDHARVGGYMFTDGSELDLEDRWMYALFAANGFPIKATRVHQLVHMHHAHTVHTAAQYVAPLVPAGQSGAATHDRYIGRKVREYLTHVHRRMLALRRSQPPLAHADRMHVDASAVGSVHATRVQKMEALYAQEMAELEAAALEREARTHAAMSEHQRTLLLAIRAQQQQQQQEEESVAASEEPGVEGGEAGAGAEARGQPRGVAAEDFELEGPRHVLYEDVVERAALIYDRMAQLDAYYTEWAAKRAPIGKRPLVQRVAARKVRIGAVVKDTTVVEEVEAGVVPVSVHMELYTQVKSQQDMLEELYARHHGAYAEKWGRVQELLTRAEATRTLISTIAEHEYCEGVQAVSQWLGVEDKVELFDEEAEGEAGGAEADDNNDDDNDNDAADAEWGDDAPADIEYALADESDWHPDEGGEEGESGGDSDDNEAPAADAWKPEDLPFQVVVSLLMPVYDGMPFLPAAVSAILEQDFPHFELIIVNDGSTDETNEFLDMVQDARVRVFTSRQNEGIPSALNRALANARGMFLMYVSSDNVERVDGVSKFVRVATEYPESEFFYSAFQHLSASGRAGKKFSSRRVPAHKLFFEWGGLASMMWSRHATDVVGLFDTTLMGVEDFDYWVRVSEQFPAAPWLEAGLVMYRTHPGSVTSHLRGKYSPLYAQMGAQALARSGESMLRAEQYFPTLRWCVRRDEAHALANLLLGNRVQRSRFGFVLRKASHLYYERALEFKPDLIEARLNLARVYCLSTNWDKCYEVLASIQRGDSVAALPAAGVADSAAADAAAAAAADATDAGAAEGDAAAGDGSGAVPAAPAAPTPTGNAGGSHRAMVSRLNQVLNKRVVDKAMVIESAEVPDVESSELLRKEEAWVAVYSKVEWQAKGRPFHLVVLLEESVQPLAASVPSMEDFVLHVNPLGFFDKVYVLAVSETRRSRETVAYGVILVTLPPEDVDDWVDAVRPAVIRAIDSRAMCELALQQVGAPVVCSVGSVAQLPDRAAAAAAQVWVQAADDQVGEEVLAAGVPLAKAFRVDPYVRMDVFHPNAHTRRLHADSIARRFTGAYRVVMSHMFGTSAEALALDVAQRLPPDVEVLFVMAPDAALQRHARRVLAREELAPLSSRAHVVVTRNAAPLYAQCDVTCVGWAPEHAFGGDAHVLQVLASGGVVVTRKPSTVFASGSAHGLLLGAGEAPEDIASQVAELARVADVTPHRDAARTSARAFSYDAQARSYVQLYRHAIFEARK